MKTIYQDKLLIYLVLHKIFLRIGIDLASVVYTFIFSNNTVRFLSLQNEHISIILSKAQLLDYLTKSYYIYLII